MSNKLKIKSLLFLMLSLNQQLFSQNYTPIDTTKNINRDLFFKEFKSRSELFLNEIKTKYNSKTAKYINNNYSQFSNEFSSEIKNGQFIFEEELLIYVNSIYTKIQSSNPELSNLNVKILISKDHSLNAYCIVDGTFVLHLGLFYWLENEAQIAGVLCHELSHKILEHSLKKQERLFIESKDVKQKISSLKSEKYKVSEKTLSLIKEQLYENGDRAKKYEFEADSLGYILYRNTNFSKVEYLSTLKLMQRYDSITPAGLKQDVYKKYFNLPNQSFNEKWLLKEDFSSYDYSKFYEAIDQDSIASHPETEERIFKLITSFPELIKETKIVETENEIPENIRKISYMETVPNLYFDENYGLAIYVALLCLEKDKENEYYFKEWLGKSFAKILEARKNYTLNRYLDKIIPNKQSESYQQFLNFIWNLNINEIQTITYFYNQKN